MYECLLDLGRHPHRAYLWWVPSDDLFPLSFVLASLQFSHYSMLILLYICVNCLVLPEREAYDPILP